MLFLKDLSLLRQRKYAVSYHVIDAPQDKRTSQLLPLHCLTHSYYLLKAQQRDMQEQAL